MNEGILHDRENNEWSEQFLKDNGIKFTSDCVKVLRLLYKGLRLTAKQVNDMTGMADGGRRLRNIFANRKDCKKDIRRKANGTGLEGVEYWLEIPGIPTKNELIESANKVIEDLKQTEKNLVTVFSLPDDTITKSNWEQKNLFQ